MKEDELPAEFIPAIYRELHSDLWYMDDQLIQEHYISTGRAEGRRAHPYAFREMLVEWAAGAPSILEIGPFFKPLFRGSKVTYFDVLDKAGLRRAALDAGHEAVESIPEIDFVSATGDLSIVDRRFALVASSHAVEHQPDLVQHLAMVERILEPDGFYVLFIPDKRFCFDHFIPESTIADVLEAAVERRRFHSLRTIIRQQLYVTHNDPLRHWRGDHGCPEHLDADSIKTAMRTYAKAVDDGQYLDRHAWQFTPESFRVLMQQLKDLGLIGLKISRIYDTISGSHEFWAVLKKD